MATKNKPNEILISRIFDAPLKMVWDAWVDPDQVAQWWGPRGFKITTHHKNVVVGGTWDYIMHGPDGVDYPNLTKFFEVEKYSRLVYDHGSDGKSAPLFRVTVNFSELGKNKTKMDMTMTLETAEAATEIKKFIKKAGGDSTWDRLAEYLSTTDKFVINRSFQCSIDQMFELWTDPNHFSKWLPPTGFTMEYLETNIKSGGTSFYSMIGNGGMTMYGKINYLEVKKPNTLIYTQIFCDKKGQVSRHPMAPTWPETMFITVSFTAEDVDTTRVTITSEVYGDATSEERETFNKAKSSMTQGWGGSFEKLDAYILTAFISSN